MSETRSSCSHDDSALSLWCARSGKATASTTKRNGSVCVYLATVPCFDPPSLCNSNHRLDGPLPPPHHGTFGGESAAVKLAGSSLEGQPKQTSLRVFPRPSAVGPRRLARQVHRSSLCGAFGGRRGSTVLTLSHGRLCGRR